MALGTAGFTAALAIHRMETERPVPLQGGRSAGHRGLRRRGQHRGRHARRPAGYRVVAVSGKAARGGLPEGAGCGGGAHAAQDLNLGSRPWRMPASPAPSTMWGGEVPRLAHAHRGFSGANIASIGMAGSAELKDDRDAVHPARRVPARHQLLRDAGRESRLAVWKPHRHETCDPPGTFERIVTRHHRL